MCSKNHNNYNVKIPKTHEKEPRFNKNCKSMKIPFVIYTGMESFL